MHPVVLERFVSTLLVLVARQARASVLRWSDVDLFVVELLCCLFDWVSF